MKKPQTHAADKVLKNRILQLLRLPKYQPLDKVELSKKLGLPSDQRAELREVLRGMEQRGEIACIRKDRYVLPETADLVTGILQVHRSGSAHLVSERAGEPDLFISAENTWTAMNKDRVVARVMQEGVEGIRQRSRGEKPSAKVGRVIRILKRANETAVGTLSAVMRGTPVDLLARMLALAGQAAPNFWLGIMLILLFSVKVHALPTGGNTDGWKSFVLPSLTLGAASSASTIRLTRSGMLDVLKSDFIRTARAKGLPERLVIWRHAMRHALLPVLTVLGIQVGFVLSGSIIVETVFSWPGMGRLMIQSINSSDYPVVQVGVMLTAIMIVTANFIVDVLYSVLDPRIGGSAI